MAKILNLDDMLELASEVLPEAEFEQHVFAIESAATALAGHLARHFNLRTTHADFQAGFGGLCAPFWPSSPDQRCPEVLHQYDEGGDFQPEPQQPKGK